MAGQGGHIPRFGDWKTGGGGTPYTVFFEDARKRKNNPPPPPDQASLARGNSGHRTPPHAAASNPRKNKDQQRSQSSGGHGGGSVPAWGQWNESNPGGGAQQYTLVFDQIRDERRSAPSTPTIEQLHQRPTPIRSNQRTHSPKKFTCFGSCWK